MELRTFIEPLKKWWWLIVLSTLAAAGVSYMVTSQQEPLFRAHATLIVGQTIDDPNPTGAEFTAGQQLATTYADIAMREPVRRAVSEKLNLTGTPRYSVVNLPRTQLLEIAVNDSDPNRAAAIANAVAEELIALSPSTLSPEEQERQAFVSAQLSSLQDRINETEERLTEKQDELAGLFSAQQIQEAQSEIGALEAKLNTLQSNYAALLSTTGQNAINTVSFIEQASPPRAPVDPQRELTIAIAAAVGFVTAVAAAYLLDFLDRTLRTVEDIAAVTDVRTLVTIPRISTRQYQSMLVTLKYPRSPIAEAYRSLRTVIRSYLGGEKGRVLLVTSPNKQDGKSVTSANLAASMAQAGSRVLLVDANLRRPSQYERFGLANKRGLSTFLAPKGQPDPNWLASTAQIRFNEVISHYEENLDIVTSGPEPENASELVGSAMMKLFLDMAHQQYDVIIIDSPPCLYVPDALDITNYAASVLLVVRAGETSPEELRDALAILNEVGATVTGIALNNADPARRGYFYGRRYEKSEKRSLRQRVAGVAARVSSLF